MSQDLAGWARQKKAWASLNGLHPASIDLERVKLIRNAEIASLTDPGLLEGLLLRLGLNDEAAAELPASLRPHAGHGLRIWQYPHQFSAYLADLARLRVRSYLEVGIRHGGSFVATTEYLARFAPLDFSVGVDIIPCPSMAAYQRLQPKAEFWCLNTRAPEFAERLRALATIDLVFIDSHHEEAQCRSELALLAPCANAIAFHDITNVGCPGIGKVWQELRSSPAYDCFEYVQQYPGLGPFMGIGLAVRKGRRQSGTAEETP
jgi:cephalosporin hydroxylase